MNINLENIDLETIVESAVVNTLTKSLGKNLPEVVDKMLNERKSGYNTTLLKDVITKAIEASVTRHVAEFVKSKELEIAEQVKANLEMILNPSFVADSIARQLKEVGFKIKPFSLSQGKFKSADDEDEVETTKVQI